ncbi:uncharacterized protein LOC135639171 [Musa acuminata AAA Group]|uniref:uncharacterized protein LOC135639171 n=1 Tax=Musa acuminata AAA Group TaxID=214697 RepID=UPI0031D41E01
MDLLDALDVSTRSIKDMLKAFFVLALYMLNCTALIELGVVPPLFSLVVKDGWRGLVEDAMMTIAQVVGCNESAKVFRRVDDINVLIDMVVGKRRRVRENATTVLQNLLKNNRDNTMGDVKEMDVVDATMRALVDNDSRTITRGKSKTKASLKVMESRQGS